MAEFSGHFDASAGTPNYDSSEFALNFVDLMFYGVAPGYENELEVAVGAGLQVTVDSGGYISKGRYYRQSEAAGGGTPFTLPIDAAPAGNSRIDRIVIEFDVSGKASAAKVSKGTDTTGTPVAPALVTGSSLWEEHLAYVTVNAGTLSSIDTETDRVILGARTLLAKLGASKAIKTDANGNPVSSTATAAELEFLAGVTSAIQTQLNAVTNRPFCSVYRSASLTSGSSIPWDAELRDTTSMHDLATNPERVTIAKTGLYDIECQVNYFINTLSGSLFCSLKVNGGTEIINWLYSPFSAGTGRLSHKMVKTLYLTAGDYLTVEPGLISSAAQIDSGRSSTYLTVEYSQANA